MSASQSKPSPDPTRTPQNGESFAPYGQLVRSLLPRASSVALFDAQGKLLWSSDQTTGPDLINSVDETLSAARTSPESTGQLRLLPGNVPVYLCWLRDDAARLLSVMTVVCRPNGDHDAEGRGFSFAYALLRPAIECLRRELVSRAAIDQLNRTVSAMDKDLELLLADGAGAPPASASGESGPSRAADELRSLLHQALEHLRASTAALIVPDKSIALVCPADQPPADTQLVARAHRQLLAMAQMRREPILINRLAPNSAFGAVPYRILSCPLRSRANRTVGVLVLFREEMFTERDARLGDILARKAMGLIESCYDILTGLYTRPAFEQRVRAVVSGSKPGSPWSALYIDGDQLHVINDNFGMHVGDAVLGRLAEL
jgi:hypothetical protein